MDAVIRGGVSLVAIDNLFKHGVNAVSVGGISALEAAATTPGYTAAEETLERINHGFFA
ncbi:hypothetical protein [Pseudomonas sp.]|uniref:hypothetical protein n=1 Tax=Pseudomonas sp. TaxID=306 RepID=UPI00262F55BB|nr:hypothetical protein [Pseudomonas sp.]